MVKICYSKTPLSIRSNGDLLEFDINRDIDIDDARKKFNEAIGQLASKLEPHQYLFSRICERNILINDMFLDFCYIVQDQHIGFLMNGERWWIDNQIFNPVWLTVEDHDPSCK